MLAKIRFCDRSLIFSKQLAACLGDKPAGGAVEDGKELLLDDTEEIAISSPEQEGERAPTPVPITVQSRTAAKAVVSQWVLGMLIAAVAGGFSSLQYTLYTLGKRHEFGRYADVGCTMHNTTACPDEVMEMFNPLGSWMVSFGLGAAAVAAIAMAAVSVLGGQRPQQGGWARVARVLPGRGCRGIHRRGCRLVPCPSANIGIVSFRGRGGGVQDAHLGRRSVLRPSATATNATAAAVAAPP